MSATLIRGHVVSLVRWQLTRDGWQPELVTGVYRGRNSDFWILTVDGNERQLERADWYHCES